MPQAMARATKDDDRWTIELTPQTGTVSVGPDCRQAIPASSLMSARMSGRCRLVKLDQQPDRLPAASVLRTGYDNRALSAIADAAVRAQHEPTQNG